MLYLAVLAVAFAGIDERLLTLNQENSGPTKKAALQAEAAELVAELVEVEAELARHGRYSWSGLKLVSDKLFGSSEELSDWDSDTGAGVCYPGHDENGDLTRDSDGADYKGCQTKTIYGKTCMDWNTQEPHSHDVGTGLPGNWCRNPDGEDTIWCYTTDPNKRWDYCRPTGVNSMPFHMRPDKRSDGKWNSWAAPVKSCCDVKITGSGNYQSQTLGDCYDCSFGKRTLCHAQDCCVMQGSDDDNCRERYCFNWKRGWGIHPCKPGAGYADQWGIFPGGRR